jgi:glucose-1-phosphate cytidylyltransferase
MEVHQRFSESWRVTLVEAGEDTMTGGRLRCIGDCIKDEEAFCFTYGDSFSNLDIGRLIGFHREHGKKVTLTAVYPPGRFGALDIRSDGHITSPKERPKGDGGLVNGDFFVLSPKVIDLIPDDSTIWVRESLETLARRSEIMVFEHHDFWQAMDTLRDKNNLEGLWVSGKAPWKVWD